MWEPWGQRNWTDNISELERYKSLLLQYQLIINSLNLKIYVTKMWKIMDKMVLEMVQPWLNNGVFSGEGLDQITIMTKHRQLNCNPPNCHTNQYIDNMKTKTSGIQACPYLGMHCISRRYPGSSKNKCQKTSSHHSSILLESLVVPHTSHSHNI